MHARTLVPVVLLLSLFYGCAVRPFPRDYTITVTVAQNPDAGSITYILAEK